MRLLENKWFWIAAFGGLFALSIDLWAWDWVEPTFFGLPYTVVYIIILEIALFILFALFNRYYWVDKEDEA